MREWSNDEEQARGRLQERGRRGQDDHVPPLYLDSTTVFNSDHAKSHLGVKTCIVVAEPLSEIIFLVFENSFLE